MVNPEKAAASFLFQLALLVGSGLLWGFHGVGVVCLVLAAGYAGLLLLKK